VPKNLSRKNWITQLLDVIESRLTVVPNETERKQLYDSLDGVISYLGQLKHEVQSLPDEHSRNEILQAVGVLRSYLMRAEVEPLYARIFGITPTKRRRPTPSPSGLSHDLEIEKKIGVLRSSNYDQRVMKLQSFSFASTRDLRAIARRLAVPVPSGVTRDGLIDKILKMGFSREGYEILSGRSVVDEDKRGRQ
jgi:hypothetical protein